MFADLTIFPQKYPDIEDHKELSRLEMEYIRADYPPRLITRPVKCGNVRRPPTVNFRKMKKAKRKARRDAQRRNRR